jgi:hypothetical protein
MLFALKSSYFWTAAGGHERLRHANLLIVRVYLWARFRGRTVGEKKNERVCVRNAHKSILILILKIVCIGKKENKVSKENDIL